MTRLLALSFLMFIYLAAGAEDIPFEFEHQHQQQKYKELVDELRCMVCQNQTLADSNAPLAQDLRDEVYKMVIEDKPKQDIINFLVQRYGDFVLYKPPLKSSTLLLWFGPFLLLVLAGIFAFTTIRDRARVEPGELSDADKEKVRRLLAEPESEEP